MHVKIDQFCSLATSPSWQAWLYHNHATLYRKFIHKLRESQGCTQNKDLMVEVLQDIDQIGGDSLIDFLQQHYPHMLSGQSTTHQQREDAQALEDDNVFQYYNPNILTYPKRQIFVGPRSVLNNKVQEFLLDKFRSDYIIIKGRAYIEYLEKNDAAIADQIPQSNWQISQYRLRQK